MFRIQTAFPIVLSAFMVAVTLVALPAATGQLRAEARVATDDQYLEGRVTVDQRIRLPRGGASTRIPVRVQLTNTGPEELEIVAPSICAVHNYHIVYPNNDLVATKGEADCDGGETSVTIPAGETIYATNSLVMQPGILETDRRDFVIYEFWGVRMKAPFSLLEYE